MSPRLFELVRDVDISGVSGIGKVAEGVVFSDGEVAIHWAGKWPTTTAHPLGIESVKAIHGHNGATRVVLIDPSGRLARIAEAHSKDVSEGGMTSGLCRECDVRYPCPTYVWATTDRDTTSTWDPADDDPP